MKSRILVSGLLFAIMSVSAIGAGFIGTPTAELKEGQWSVGYSFMYSSMDLDKSSMGRSGEFYGAHEVIELMPQSYKLSTKDVEIRRHYATFGYGVKDWCEIYFQLGSADFKSRLRNSNDPDSDWTSFNSNSDFARGLGAKFTFHEKDNVRWGASFQMNWLDSRSVDDGVWANDEAGVSGTWREDIDIRSYDLLIAVGPTVDMGAIKVYGGPYYYHFSGELEDELKMMTSGDVVQSAVWRDKGDLESSSNFGAFIGAQLVLTETTSMTVEVAYGGGDSWAVGAGITWKF